jgi:Cu(I)/Ag(I) efflux system membrane fusion protein
VWVLADVSETDADRLTPAAAVDVHVPGRRGVLRARVASDVPAQFDATRQSVSVRLDVDNSSRVLRPDMFVDVEATISRAVSLTVPADAIVDSGRRRAVFVETAAGVFEPRLVEIGWQLAGRTEIINGLSAGERVVAAGAFLLDAENRVRAANLRTEP